MAIQPSLANFRLPNGQVCRINSCPSCLGSLKCHDCNGTGKVHRPRPDNPNAIVECWACIGNGICSTCSTHVEVLRKFAEDFRVGNVAIAEATLQHAFTGASREEGSIRTGYQAAGAGGGAILGTLILPGVGTVIGGMLGNMAGQAMATDGAPGAVDWKRADLYFCLGLVYAKTSRMAGAREAWVKALSLNPEHAPSKSALQGVS